MKKAMALSAALMLLSVPGLAYENSYAGYSVKDKNPVYVMESQKVYAFFNIDSKYFSDFAESDESEMHFVNYYTSDDMKKILGQDFSTAYFDEQYEKLAVLQRSDLNLKTVPLPLLDMDKYAAVENDGNILLQEKFKKYMQEKPEYRLRIDKIGKFKTITLSYLYKQMDNIVAIDTTLLSANDRLYMLSSGKTTESKSENKDKQKENVKTDIAADVKLQDMMKIINLDPKDVDSALLRKGWKEHYKFVKSFKAIQPSQEHYQLKYYDATLNKYINLPEDWFYAQTTLREKEGTGNITVSASLPAMVEIANSLNFDAFDDILPGADIAANAQDIAIISMEGSGADYIAKQNLDVIFDKFDAALITASFISKEDNYSDIIANENLNMLNMEANEFLRTGFERAKKHSDEYFKLNSYNYDLTFTKLYAALNADTQIMLMNKFVFDNQFRAKVRDNKAAVLLYVNKKGKLQNEDLAKQIQNWQF